MPITYVKCGKARYDVFRTDMNKCTYAGDVREFNGMTLLGKPIEIVD